MVNHAPMAPTGHTAVPQAPMSIHRREPLVHEADRRVRHPSGELARPGPHLGRRRTFATVQRQRQTDDDLQRTVLLGEDRDLVEVAAVLDVAGDRADRGGEHAVRVAGGQADPDVADVHAEPHPAAQAAQEPLPVAPVTVEASSRSTALRAACT